MELTRLARQKQYPASTSFISWAQSISGMLTKIKTEYGSVPEMTEHADWDENKTDFTLSLIKSLRIEIVAIEKELAAHVAEKFGKD